MPGAAKDAANKTGKLFAAAAKKDPAEDVAELKSKLVVLREGKQVEPISSMMYFCGTRYGCGASFITNQKMASVRSLTGVFRANLFAFV